MNDMKRQSIQRWEYEDGALLPPDCNVHFWRSPLGYSVSKSPHGAENQLTAKYEFTAAPITNETRFDATLRNN